MTSAPGSAFAAPIASRREQSAPQTPSLVSAILVTVNVAANAGVAEKSGMSTIPRAASFAKRMLIICQFFLCYRARPPFCAAQSRSRGSHSGAGGGGVGAGSGGGGGGGLVGPIFTTCTSTLSSPVVTLPPVLPPELTLPWVTLVMPPEGGGGVACPEPVEGVAGLGGGGVGVRSIVRPVDPLLRRSCAIK